MSEILNHHIEGDSSRVEARETERINFAFLQLLGKRKYQEDRVFFLENEASGESFAVVIDAHDSTKSEEGGFVANIVQEYFKKYLSDPEFDFKTQISQVFKNVEQKIFENNFGQNTGAVVTVCCMKDEKISYAYVGDCEMKKVSESGVMGISLTPPHDATNGDEIERLRKRNSGFENANLEKRAGGNIHKLAVSRVLGDSDFDEAISEPQTGEDEMLDKFLILASDGFWNLFKKTYWNPNPKGKDRKREIEKILQEESDPAAALSRIQVILERWKQSVDDNLTLMILKLK